MTDRPLDHGRGACRRPPTGRLGARLLRGVARTAGRAGALCFAMAVAVASSPGEAWAQGASVAEATDADKARAQELYKSGAMSFEFRRWGDALRKFRESYAVVRSPNTHLMIARALTELGQKTEAFNELVATEAEAREAGERYADAASKSNELRAALAPDVAVLIVEVEATGDPSAATVLVGGTDLPRARWGAPFAMAPGEVEVVGRFHGADRGRRKVVLKQGASESVKLVVGAEPEAGPVAPAPASPPAATTPPPSSAGDDGSLVPLIAISAGVGAGGLAVFTVFGMMNHSTYDALEQRCASGCSADDSSVQDDIDEGQTQQTVANVGLVVGAIGVAAAATFLVLELTDDDAPSASTAGAPQVGVQRVGVGPTGVVASGAF